MDPTIALLLRILDEAFDRKSWHGTNLRGSIRGLAAAEASWRPAPRRHSIWEIVVHAAYWKYTIRRPLLGEKRGSFPLTGSNWFERPQTSAGEEKLWQSDVRLFVSMHGGLREAVALLSADDLRRVPPGGTSPVEWLITGIAAHDLYHAGQIQLLKRLRASRSMSA